MTTTNNTDRLNTLARGNAPCVDASDSAVAAIEVNEQLTHRSVETLSAAELRSLAGSAEALDSMIDDLHKTSRLPADETGTVLSAYRAEVRGLIRDRLIAMAETAEAQEENEVTADAIAARDAQRLASADTLEGLIAECAAAARGQGWTGDRYDLTASDCEWICERLGYRPTREQWAAAGEKHVGGAHVA